MSLFTTDPETGERLFNGKPERWWNDPTWQCPKGHVSKMYIKSEVRGALCPECMEPVHLVAPDTRETAGAQPQKRGES